MVSEGGAALVLIRRVHWHLGRYEFVDGQTRADGSPDGRPVYRAHGQCAGQMFAAFPATLSIKRPAFTRVD